MKLTPAVGLGITLVVAAIIGIAFRELHGQHIPHWYFFVLAFGCLVIAPIEGGKALDKLVVIVTSIPDILPGGRRKSDPAADAVVVPAPPVVAVVEQEPTPRYWRPIEDERGDETGG